MRFVAILFLQLILTVGGLRAQGGDPGWLGVEIQDLSKEEADALGWDGPRGAKITGVTPGSPAATAGLQLYDVLVSLDGMEIENQEALGKVLDGKTPGSEIRFTIRRGTRESRLSVKLATRPAHFSETPSAHSKMPPMLDPGGHMALISAVAFTPDGKQLVSAAHDKTIRVWDLESGRTLRTIRGDIAPGQGGKIYSMALSRDGKWLAAGGWFTGSGQESTAIRIFDFSSGKLVTLLRGHGDIVTSLDFSPDSRYLVSGSGDRTAIVWDVPAGQPLQRLQGHTEPIYDVAFMPDGRRVVTGALDRELRLWSLDNPGASIRLTGHATPVYSVAVGADGTIASGDFSGEIRLWNGETGAALRVLAQQEPVGLISFDPSGRFLLVGVGGGTFNCRVYDITNGRNVATYSGHDFPVRATAISPDGRWAATGGGANHEIHLWNLQTGERRTRLDGEPLTLSGVGRPVWAVGFSADGKEIAWGNTLHEANFNDRGPLEHVLKLPLGDVTVSAPRPLDANRTGEFLRASSGLGDWSLQARRGGPWNFFAILDIKNGSQVVASVERGALDGFGHHSYTLIPQDDTIVSGGSSGVLSTFDRQGQKLGDFVGHEGDVWAVAQSPDGRFLLSGSHDQTLRLWNRQTHELLASFFTSSTGEWVMWTQQGYYDASGPGAEMIGWQINNGPQEEAKYVTAAQLRKSLNRPDIVARSIQLASAEAAVQEAYGTNFALGDLLDKPVPRFRITSPETNTVLSGGKTELEIALESTPDPVKLISIQVNGRQVAEHLPNQGGRFQPGTLKFGVPLSKGRNIIRVTAVNETGDTPAEIIVGHDGEGDLDKRGTLYVLAIGVDKYPNVAGKDLRYSGADAKAFADAVEKHVGPSHDRIVKRVLINDESIDKRDIPTAANIINALGELRQAKQTDTIMVFAAGHGENEGPHYRFLPTDTDLEPDGGFVPSSIVPWRAFQEAIEGAKGRRILFIDTCHSGNSYNQRLSNDSYQANILVYSAARWDQLSWERADLGHGLFTFATIEGIGGKAAKSTGDRRITTLTLRDFLAARVKELAKPLGADQEPQYFRGRDAEDYLLTSGSIGRGAQ